MIRFGISLALLSGICNGLFTAPMRIIPRWRWENIWLVFIVTSCIAAPVLAVQITAPGFWNILSAAPVRAVSCAVGFGFAWGFGAILFGLSVARLGVSVANTLVIGLSSALGSLVPLALKGRFGLGPQQVLLYGGVLAFVLGVWICGKAARLRDAGAPLETASASTAGYFFAVGAGVMSAIFNMGYTLALPIAAAGTQLGYSSFASTNCIWLLMLGAGALPNIAYCIALARKHHSGELFFVSAKGAISARRHSGKQLEGFGPRVAPVLREFLQRGLWPPWALSVAMGVLWGGSIFLYGAATPMLGDLGPSIGWPLSLAMGLITSNLMGFLLREWRAAPRRAVHVMALGLSILLVAIVLCAFSSKAGET